ncbi:MAG: flavin reductase family protein [Candidatus Hydromicrobium sp.]
MNKIKYENTFGPIFMPVTLIGANIGNRPNFFTCALITKVQLTPAIWAFAASVNRYSIEGIRENKTFSINFPSIDQMAKTDYCGIVSGKQEDKSKVFDVFYGDLKTAPMIKECPICMELSLWEIKNLPNQLLVFGEVNNIYVEDKYLTDGRLDIEKVNPFVLTSPDSNYRTIGEIKAKAWNVGKNLQI